MLQVIYATLLAHHHPCDLELLNFGEITLQHGLGDQLLEEYVGVFTIFW